MNETDPSSIERASVADASSPKRSETRMVFYGFGAVVGSVLFALVTGSDTLFQADLVVVPIIAMILAIIPDTRKFGLGALLAWFLGIVTLLGMCRAAFSRI